MSEPRDPLDGEQVRRLGELARLAPAPGDEERLLAELRGILDYVARLRQLDTDGVPPSPSVLSPKARWREDEPEESLPPAEALREAPDRDGDFFRVPRVIE